MAESTKKRILPAVVRIITILASAALFLSYLAAITDPAFFWPLAFAGLAYPFILALNLIIMLCLAFARRRLGLLPLAVVILGWPFLKASIGFRPGGSNTEQRADGVIKVLSYNVHFFRGPSADRDDATYSSIRKFIAKERPDVVCLQEYTSLLSAAHSTTDSISRAMNRAGYYFNIRERQHSSETGMIIFSKYPIIRKGWIKLSEVHNQCLFADIKRGKDTFRVYNVHLESIGLRPAALSSLKAREVSERQKIRITRGIGGQLKHAFIARSRQVRLVKEHANTCTLPYIIAGDFNDTPVSYAVNRMSKGLKNAFTEKGSGLCRTYNGKYPNFQIDYILTSPHFTVESYRVGKVRYSDHFPVMAELRPVPETDQADRKQHEVFP